MKKILVAPLNWGLGHATRCIPVINELITHGAVVSIASDGNALSLLRKEFPQLTFFELPSYNISYGSGDNMVFNMLANFPKIKRAITLEHEALQEIQKQNIFDAIISDNRYGIWHEKTHNIFITHQINIQVPKHLKWLQPLLLNYNLKQISNFNECWIPDADGEINLSGDLSHNCKLPDNSYYIGSLSRFYSWQSSVGSRQLSVGSWQQKSKATNDSNFEKEPDTYNDLLPTEDWQQPISFSQLPTANCELLIILSGPEPQRSIFEKIIIDQIKTVSQKTLIVQGLTEKMEDQQLSENVWMISYLTSADLFEKINHANLIISRSGYSSIMDLAACSKKAILVPTPGQTEQEYIATTFLRRNVFYSAHQNKFNLNEAIEKAKSFTGLNLKNDGVLLRERIDKLLS